MDTGKAKHLGLILWVDAASLARLACWKISVNQRHDLAISVA
jgi:hypothetical protein